MFAYLKAITAAIVVGLTALELALADDVLTLREGVTSLIAFLVALGAVWATPNEQFPPESEPETPVDRIRAHIGE